jgi:hypothetical protein
MDSYISANWGIPGRRLKIFTWHIHGSYLYYLSQGYYDIFIPVKEDKSEGYYGRGETFPFGQNVHEIPAQDVRNMEFDCILFQTNNNYLSDQHQILSDKQKQLPKIYLEHDPPIEHTVDTRHVVDDPDMLLVHVTHFNKLMWNNNRTPTRVIDHGVIVPEGVHYTGEKERGIVVINNIQKRGRRLGFDIFLEVRKHVPIDLIGMEAEEFGLGEVKHPQLPAFISQYRFFFNPIRYTSLGLSVCEAMMLGMPVVGIATTEMVTTIRNGVSGYLHTDVDYLIKKMKDLLQNKTLAEQLGREGQRTAGERFNINRFVKDWEETFMEVVAKKTLNRRIAV